MADDVLLTLKEVLRILKIGRTKWYAGIKRGEFPRPVKLGRCSRWWRSQVMALIPPPESSPGTGPTFRPL